MHGESVVFDAHIDVFLVDARYFDLERDVMLVLVNVDGRGEARADQRLILAIALGFAK